MIELHDFHNDGSGWVCRHCERELAAFNKPDARYSRMFSEGEAECKQPQMYNRALAKWADKTRRSLVCPRCGITELVDIS